MKDDFFSTGDKNDANNSDSGESVHGASGERTGRDQNQERDQQKSNRNIPWQMEWKHPQLIASPPGDTDQGDNDNARVVGLTSARLSPFETSQIISFGDPKRAPKPSTDSNSGKDNHCLLTVTLLGTPSDKTAPKPSPNGNDKNKTTTEKTEQALSLASEVLLEVVDVPSSSQAAESPSTTRIIRSKRLRWPESIFDSNFKTASTTPSTTSAKRKRKHQRAKRKNLLASVFLPLIGIDEGDEYGTEEMGASKTHISRKQQHPTIGIVSATLCRRPGEDVLAKSKKSVTKDIVELMSFGGDGGGMIGHDAEISAKSDTNGDARKEGDSRQEGYVPAQAVSDASALTESKPKQQSATSIGELSFVCVSQAGDVFVYDPIKLLLGIDDVSSLREEERDAKKSLEGASNFFFGQELFQNLQETWKPLAEPSTRIHLSIFEHDEKKKQPKKTPHQSIENLVQSNQELSNLAQTGDNESTGSSKQERNKSNSPRKTSIGSESSLSSFRSGDGTIATSATDALTVVQTMALELQTNVDEALSMLPYLLNPLLEPSTLKDRTVQNRPHAITVTGNIYVVVTGSGLKRKDLSKNFSKPKQSSENASRVSDKSHVATLPSRGSPQKSVPNEDETSDSKEAAISSSETSKEADVSEQKILRNSFSEEDEIVEEDDTLSTNNPHDERINKLGGDNASEDKISGKVWSEDESAVDKVDSPDFKMEDSRKMGGNRKRVVKNDAWWETDTVDDQEDSADYQPINSTKEGNIEKIRINNVTEKEQQREKKSISDQDSINDKASGNFPKDDDEENSQRHYFDGYENGSEGGGTEDHGGFVTFLSTARWSETRTLFLPFVPVRTSHISQWNGMELLWVIGEFKSLLIRMDSTGPVPVRIGDIMFGGETPDHDTDLFQTATASNHTHLKGGISSGNELSPLSVKRFQVLPIDLGSSASISPRLLCASNTGVDPPSILELHLDLDTDSKKGRISEEEITSDHERQRYQQSLVLLKTLGYCTPQGTVVLRHAPSHVAKIMIDRDEAMIIADNSSNEAAILAEHRQGWSLVGYNGHFYFICWEGSTLLQGAFVQELYNSPDATPLEPLHITHILPISTARDVSLDSTSSSHHYPKMGVDNDLDTIGRSNERDGVFENPQRFSSAVANLPLIDEFQQSMSPLPNKDRILDDDCFSPKGISGVISDSSKSTSFSRREYSEYLLQQCSSWTQLEDTLNDRIVLERQGESLGV